MSNFTRSSLDGSQVRYSNFRSRTARDETGELNRRTSIVVEEEDENSHAGEDNPYEPATNDSIPTPHEHSFLNRLGIHNGEESGTVRRRSVSGKRSTVPDQGLFSSVQMNNEAESKKANGDPTAPKAGLGPRPVGGSEKMGTFSGVYTPTCLNVLSILML